VNKRRFIPVSLQVVTAQDLVEKLAAAVEASLPGDTLGATARLHSALYEETGDGRHRSAARISCRA